MDLRIKKRIVVCVCVVAICGGTCSAVRYGFPAREPPEEEPVAQLEDPVVLRARKDSGWIHRKIIEVVVKVQEPVITSILTVKDEKGARSQPLHVTEKEIRRILDMADAQRFWSLPSSVGTQFHDTSPGTIEIVWGRKRHAVQFWVDQNEEVRRAVILWNAIWALAGDEPGPVLHP